MGRWKTLAMSKTDKGLNSITNITESKKNTDPQRKMVKICEQTIYRKGNTKDHQVYKDTQTY